MNRQNPAQRRYLKRFFPAMLGYVVALFACTLAIRHYQPHGATLVVLAVLPAIPIIAVIAVMGLYLVEEKDEYLRSRLVTAMIGGIGILLAVTTVWGFLEDRGVIVHFPTYLAFPLWCGAFGMVQCGMTLRDRMSGRA